MYLSFFSKLTEVVFVGQCSRRFLSLPLVSLALPILFLGSLFSMAVAQDKLAWDDPNPSQNVGGYYLYYWQSGQTARTKRDIGRTNPYALTNLSLVTGQTYNFAVAAYDIHRSNESALSNTVSKTIASNQAPVAQNLAISTPEDRSIQGSLQAIDANNNSLTYQLVSNGSLGTVALTNTATGAFTYTPRSNANGTDTFTFRASDGVANSNTATVTVTITPVNDAPVAVNDSANTQRNTAVTIAVRTNDSDVDGDSLTLTAVTPGSRGQTAIMSGSVRYTPNSGITGQDTFTYTISDGRGGSANGIVTVTISSVNSAPVAHNGTLKAQPGVATSGTLSASDSDGNSLTYRVITNGSKGVVRLLNPATGAYTYTPTASATGTDIFTFRANDGIVDSSLGTVTVTISPSQEAIFEVGAVTADHTWKRVALQKSFTAPVVIAKLGSYYGSDPAVARIRNITASSFEVRVQEWEYLDGTHTAETIHYLVMEAGHHTLPGNIQVEAGTRVLNNPAQLTSLSFAQPFRTPPVVLTAVSSVNDSTAVTTRVQDISTARFRARLQEQEANTTSHAVETVAYIAWEPSEGSLSDGQIFEVGLTSRTMDHVFRPIVFLDAFPAVPFFLADIQTAYGTDPVTLRCKDLYLGGVDVIVEEEQSQDSETIHYKEVVGYMVFSNP